MLMCVSLGSYWWKVDMAKVSQVNEVILLVCNQYTWERILCCVQSSTCLSNIKVMYKEGISAPICVMGIIYIYIMIYIYIYIHQKTIKALDIVEYFCNHTNDADDLRWRGCLCKHVSLTYPPQCRIYASEKRIDNGLSPLRHQAIF